MTTTLPPDPVPAHRASAEPAPTLDTPDTPFAVVDLDRARVNADRLRHRIAELGVTLRPHVKTSKSVPLVRLMHGGGTGPITVSTLREAEHFADAGWTDITYAVGIAPGKLDRVLALVRRGVTLRVLLDGAAQAEAVVAASAVAGVPIPALVEIDADGHRAGLRADDPELLRIGAALEGQGCLAGVLVHAGESYFAPSPEAQARAAAEERDAAVAAAAALRDAGCAAPVVSVGSTPTAHAASDLTGVTEVRAGNYIFFDLVMAGIGVCTVEDLALSVVVTVIGHRPERGWILTDGGWMAMSRDRGTAAQAVDQGYGLVCDVDGRLVDGLVMTAASQEHGVLTARDGAALPDLSVGTRLRVLPNHACATAAQFAEYHVLEREGGADGGDGPRAGGPVVRHRWPRVNGW